MTRRKKIFARVLRGASDANIAFNELCELLRDLGFDERVRGSHRIFTRADVEEIHSAEGGES